MQNLADANPYPVHIIDPLIQKVFPIKLLPNTDEKGGPNRPSTSARINYSIAECRNSIYMYGGVDNNSNILETTDVFDC